MRKLQVYIEIEGMQTYVGSFPAVLRMMLNLRIRINILLQANPPISISLPISGEPFSAETKKLF